MKFNISRLQKYAQKLMSSSSPSPSPSWLGLLPLHLKSNLKQTVSITRNYRIKNPVTSNVHQHRSEAINLTTLPLVSATAVNH